ncbi:MAG TPA: TonB family protein, partial [Chthoniobacterales bacterium]
MAKPQFYKPAPKWQTFAALAAALALEFAAIGVASLHKEPEIPTDAGFQSTPPVDAMITELPPEPTPPPDDQPPPPPPPPPDQPTEFTIEEPTPPPRPKNAPTPKPRAKVASTLPRSAAPHGPVSYYSAKASFIRAPHPAYPYEARRMHATGSGVFLLHFDSNGDVTGVDTIQSTGNAILDSTSINAFQRWLAKPG